jgi:hypothetical protein
MATHPTTGHKTLMLSEAVEGKILFIRGHRVMLDADLAEIYRVTTKRLNEQVKRNHSRFPEDFMFRLTAQEVGELNRSQIATGSQKHRDPRFPPYAFTEHGAVMLASVLNSTVAVEASIQVVRAFIRIRTILAAHKELARKLEELERKYDARFKVVFEAIRQLMRPELPEPSRRPIGFVGGEEK